jgi:hypothetical protein
LEKTTVLILTVLPLNYFMNKTLQDVVLFRYQYDIHSQSWELVKILASNPDTFKDILVGKEKHPSFDFYFMVLICRDFLLPFIVPVRYFFWLFRPLSITFTCFTKVSVAVRDVYPGFRIQPLQQKRRGKNLVVAPFFCSHKYDKLKINLFFKLKSI